MISPIVILAIFELKLMELLVRLAVTNIEILRIDKGQVSIIYILGVKSIRAYGFRLIIATI